MVPLDEDESHCCGSPAVDPATKGAPHDHQGKATPQSPEFLETCPIFQRYLQETSALILNLESQVRVNLRSEIQSGQSAPHLDNGDENDNDSNTDDVSIVEDDAEVAFQVAFNNSSISPQVFTILCAADLGSSPIFLYDKFVRPDAVAGALTDKAYCRTYEQAMRMMPGTLLEHSLIGHWRAGAAAGVETAEGMEVQGMLLFSTTGRERVMLQEQHRGFFKTGELNARVLVEGGDVVVSVGVFTYI